MSWCTIESDPGVFTELISKVGIKGVQVEELYDLEEETFAAKAPIHGLVFLFKWQQDDNAGRTILPDGAAPGVFFAKQMINNACATQAILNVLFNRPNVDLGEELTNFKDFTLNLPADMRGYAIGNSESIREAHNSFARPEPFVFEQTKTSSDDEAFHFIGYVPVDGNLYELDGLQAGPVLLGECTDADWLSKARPAIQARIEKYSQKEIRFNLLAITKDRKLTLMEKLEAVATRKADASNDASVAVLLEEEEAQLKRELQQEEERRESWRAENVRRKHNYIPFVFNLIKELAKKGKLAALVASGKESAKAKQEAEAAKEKKKAGEAK